MNKKNEEVSLKKKLIKKAKKIHPVAKNDRRERISQKISSAKLSSSESEIENEDDDSSSSEKSKNSIQ